MRPASFKHLLTKPALLIAAGLVLLGAAAGQAETPPGGRVATPEGVRNCRAAKPSFDALYRCLSASFAPEDDTAFSHVGLHAAFAPRGVRVPEPSCAGIGRDRPVSCSARSRWRQCAVGPSPPV
jgi:hypothetical protein